MIISKKELQEKVMRQQECMKDLSDHGKKNLGKKPLDRKWVIALFSKFHIIYPHKWSSAFDNDEMQELAINEWGERLAGITGEQIKTALDNLPKEWPPTPMEFRELCEGEWMHKNPAYREYNKSRLIEKKCDPEIARENLKKIHELMPEMKVCEVTK